MKLFVCQSCQQLLYFENSQCMRCGHQLGFLPENATLSALEPAGGDGWTALAAPGKGPYRLCANAAHASCNWLVEADADTPFCLACHHNRTIPDLTAPEHLEAWQKLEIAKHRLFYTLLKLRLPLVIKAENEETGLAFDFMADPDPADPSAPKILTGHDNGLITINLAEADDAERERRRSELGEPYRTLLGHMRHEVGHYYWDRLVRDAGRLDACRAIFGDESADYGEALQRHYANGVPADWQESYVSSYATAHPWEDFAETWAHYLHIVDTLETAKAFQISVNPEVTKGDELAVDIDFNVYKAKSIEPIIEAWLPLSYAVNSLNRSMGLQDLYPFVLSAPVIVKLGYMHDLLREAGGR